MGDTKETKKKPSFFKGLKKEFKKVTWPTKSETAKQTTAVVIITVIVGALIAALDSIILVGVDFINKF